MSELKDENMKHRKIIFTSTAILSVICIGSIGWTAKKVLDNQLFAPSCASNQIATPNLRQVAESITVKILSGNGGGSGTLIDKKGQVYTVLTNQHVLTPGEPYRIQTPDGVVYSANAITNVNFGKNDLALLQFRADANYAVAVLAALETRFLQETGFLGNLAVNEEVFAAGFPFEREKLTFNSGKISQLPDKALQGGYRIGYTNDIQKGMSGGPILNSQGEVIGINGVHAYALFGDPYVFEDGSKPNNAEKEQMTRSSWGVPIQTVAQAVPQFVPTNLVKDIDRIAQKITVRIDRSDGENGSGIIIAQQGKTYYIVTANHVVQDETQQYQVTTPDGRCYPVNYRTVKNFGGVDLAVLQFTSNQSYRVATLANYDLGTNHRNVFVSGWPRAKQGANGKRSRLFTVGVLFDKETKAFVAKDSFSFTDGYDLVYTNITGGGVSGGPVLDTRGRVIGIHGRAEGEVSVDEGGQERRIQLGYSLGVPIATFLNIANQVGIESRLRVENYKPPRLTQPESRLIEAALLPVEVPTSSNAIDWLNYGNHLYRSYRIEEAIAAFDKAIELKPDFYQAWYARGLIWLLFKKRDPEALASFDKTTQIEPKFSPAWRWRGVTLIRLNRDGEALVSFNKAIELDPKDFFPHLARGAVYHDLKEYQKAIADSNETIRLQPDYAAAYLVRGNAYSELKEYQKAIADFNEAIRLKPDYPDAYNSRGRTYGKLKEYQKAIADFNEVIRLKPDFADAYNNRGNAYSELKEYQKAIADYNEAIRLQPDFTEAYGNRGIVYDNLKEYQKAIADYNEAIRLQPDFADVYNNRGKTYGKLKKYQEALADYNETIRLQPDLVDAYLVRGLTYFNLKKYQKALADYNEAIRLKPDFAIAYNNRGIAYFLLKQYKQALADYNEAIRLKSDFADAYLVRGLAYSKLAEYQQALADYNEVIRLQPDHALAYANRGVAKRDSGDKQGAITDFQKAAQLFQQQGDMANYQIAQGYLKQLEK